MEDERYLPFEGTGAVSSWTLTMPRGANQIDYANITDVIITLDYTALDGGTTLRNAVLAVPAVSAYDGGVVFALAQQCAAAWSTFMGDRTSTSTQTLSFTLPQDIAPANITDCQISGVYLRLDVDQEVSLGEASGFLQVTVPWDPAHPIAVTLDQFNGFDRKLQNPVSLSSLAGAWTAQFTLASTPPVLKKGDFLDQDKLKNIAVIIHLSGRRAWSKAALAHPPARKGA
jgi:hypothetical protein